MVSLLFRRLAVKITAKSISRGLATYTGWLRAEWIAIGVFIALVIARFSYPAVLSMPKVLSVLLGFWAVLIFPGLILSGMLPALAGADWLKRIPIAFSLSFALWAIPCYILMTVHSTWTIWYSVYLTINGSLILIYCLWAWRKGKIAIPSASGSPSRISLTTILLVILLLAVLTSLAPLTTNGFLDGDVLTAIAMIRSVVVSDHFNVTEPLFGAGLPMPPRGAANPWLLLPAFLTHATGIDPLALINSYLPAFLAILAVLSLYAFVQEYSHDRNLALFVALFFVIFLASNPIHRHGNPSYMLFRRMISDKNLLLYIMVPIGLTFGRRFLVLRQARYLILAGFVGLGISFTHALIALFYVISTTAFSGMFWLFSTEASGKRLKLALHVAALTGVCLATMAVPIMQSREVSSESSYLFIKDFNTIPLVKTNTLLLPFLSVPSLGVPGGRVPNIGNIEAGDSSPFLLRRLYSQIRAQGLIILDGTHYMTSPDYILDLGTLLALALTPFLLLWLRRDHLAQYLLIVTLVYPAINFNPLVAPIVGRFVTPWLIYRFTWPLPIAVTLAYFLYKPAGWFLSRLERLERPLFPRIIVSVLPSLILLAAAALLWPQVKTFTGILLNETKRSEAFSSGLTDYIQQHVATDQSSTILADYDTNQIFAALFDKPDLVAQRYNTTSEEFPGDMQDVALQRSLDVDYFTSTQYADRELAAMLKRYDVDYVLVRYDQALICQIPYLTNMFEPLFSDDIYHLYRVKWPLAEDPVLEGNSLLLNGQWEEAKAAFESILERDPNSVLAFLGLGQALGKLGYPDQALDQYQAALVIRSQDSCVLQKTAEGYFEIGDLPQAIDAYKAAIQVDPKNPDLFNRLGDFYLLAEDKSNAQYNYLRSITIRANLDPQEMDQYLIEQGISLDDLETYTGEDLLTFETGTPDYYALVTQLFLQKGWYEDAFASAKLAYQLETTEGYGLLVAFAAAKAGYTDESLAYYQWTAKEAPALDTPYIKSGDLYRSSGKYDQALVAYQQAIKRSAIKLDWNVSARMSIGAVYTDEGDTERAVQTFLDIAHLIPSVASPYVAIGNIRMSQDREEEAITAYEQGIQADPLDIMPYNQLGAYYLTNGLTDLALEQFQEALKNDPSSYLAWSNLGLLYSTLGDLDQAQSAFENSLKYNPINASGYIGLADVYQKRGHWASAVATMHQAIIETPYSSYVFVSMGNIYSAQGQSDQASAMYQRAIQLDEQNLNAYTRLSTIDWQQGLIDEAVSVNETAVKAIPDSATAQLALGNTYKNIGRFTEAAESYEKVIELDPTLTGAYTALAQIYLIQSNDFNAVLDLYRGMIEANPASSAAYLASGSFYQSQGQFADAETAYRTALSLDSSNYSVYVSLSNLQQYRGDWPDAIQTLQDGLRTLPDSDTLYQYLADLDLQRGDLDAAQTAYSQTVTLNSTNIAGYVGLSKIAQYSGDKEAARQALDQAVAANPKTAQAYIALGAFLQGQGELNDAEAQFRQAVEVEPANVSAYTSLGQFYQSQKLWAESMAVYQDALSLFPTNASLYLAVGNLKQASGQTTEAYDWFQGAILLDQSNPASYLTLASIYQSQGKWDEAQDALVKALAIQPTNTNSYLSLGNLYYKLHRLDEARAAFASACNLNPGQAACWSGLGNVYISQRAWREAEKAFQQAISAAPTSSAGYISLGQLYQIMGQFTEAEGAFGEGLTHSLDESSLRLARAAFYTNQGMWEQAQVDYEAVWRIAPAQNTGRVLAQFYTRRGKWEQALATYQEMTGLSDSSAQSYTDLGGFYTTRGDWNSAITAYQQGILRDKTNVGAYAGLAQVYMLQGRLEDAMNQYHAATMASPEDPQAFLNLGDAELARLEYPAAEEAYHWVLTLDPWNVNAWVKLDNLDLKTGGPGIDLTPLEQQAEAAPTLSVFTTLAYQYQVRGDWPSALKWYQKAVALEPYSSASWLAMANYYRALQDWQPALDASNKALQYEPSSASAWLAKGSAQSGLGLSDEASSSYAQAIEADPSQISGYTALATMQWQAGLIDQAVNTLEQGLAASPAAVVGYQALGQLYAASGDPAQAQTAYQAGLALAPGTAALYVSMASISKVPVLDVQEKLAVAVGNYNYWQDRLRTLQSIEQTRHTLTQIEEAKTALLSGQAQLHVAQVVSQQILEDADAVRSTYQEALRLQPDNASALVGLGQLAASFGQKEEALAYYQQAVATNPSSAMAWNALGNAYLDFARPEEALVAFQTALKYSPNNLGAFYGLVTGYTALGQLDAIDAAVSVENSQYWWNAFITYFRDKDTIMWAQAAQEELIK